MNVRLAKEQKIKIHGSEDLWKVMQQILLRENKIRRGQEHFWVVGLDGKGKILFIELISLGANNRVNANPPDIFRMAIYKQAVKLVLAHNHPSGTLKPSAADKNFTDRLLKVGMLINIEVVDHLIITETKYISFEDLGLMDDFRFSPTYQILDQDRIMLDKLKQEIEKEQVAKKKAISIAKKLKKKGMDEGFIKEVTGLKLAEIRKL
jgi:DNA repair protein RadC